MSIDQFSGASTEGCEEESWSPEVITLYGDSATVNRKLAGFEMNLPKRRIFGFTVDTEAQTVGAFFEQTSPGVATIFQWSGSFEPGLHDKIADAIMRNKGVNCVGEQTKALLAELSGYSTQTGVATPVNAKAAFSHQIREAGTAYQRTTVYLMC